MLEDLVLLVYLYQAARKVRVFPCSRQFFETLKNLNIMKVKSLKVRNIYFALLTLFVLTFTFFALRPLPKASLSNCIKYSGVVSEILKGDGEGDIVVKLKNSKNYYYINRAIDNGHSVEVLQEKLVDKKIELLTISHWTPLDPASKTKHIAEIKTDGLLIYTEL